ncbi:Pectate lyase superfamily protein [Planctomycetes bacterium Pan216]|uniref:Pectate lyase superfamily protein n=1 Tax=Kolteria novifilia TaxID=2527975 RepID=A0A518BAI4_9BACT|nr:Pectate lyase superfamily protein [Planctomycetes bacterium Pan216]
MASENGATSNSGVTDSMHQFAFFVIGMTSWLVAAPQGEGRLLDLTSSPYAATADGTGDSRSALSRAFRDAQPGDTIYFPPGDYRVVLPGGALTIPAGVTLLGHGGESTILLESNASGTDYREFLRPSDNVTLEGLTIERAGSFTGVLLPFGGSASHVVVRDCRIVGHQSAHRGACHCFRVGFGTVRDFTLDQVTIEECAYGLFQSNDATGTIEEVTVTNCRFHRNTASDLEFNAPKGKMRRIVVRDCFFSDNQSKGASSGFAVGFANVRDGRVENCVIANYGSEALHVEDRSENIQLVGNKIVGGSRRQNNGVILVVNDSRHVTIADNFVDGRPNTNKPHLILVTAGGDKFPKPTKVTVTGNVLVNGPATRTWYLQPGSTAPREANIVVKWEPSK